VSSTASMLSAVGIASAITFALRAGPFVAIRSLRSSRLMHDLAGWMPGGLMLILLVYLLRTPVSESATHGILAVCSLATIIGLHWWRANALLSIFAGTGLYVIFLKVVLQ
jgi:branched-subunit amino acid transport protein AzlD